MLSLPTPALQPPAWVGRSVMSVCLSAQQTWYTYSYSSRSACIDPEDRRSKVKVTWLQKPSRLLVTRAATAVCCCCRRGSACRYDCLCFLVFFGLVYCLHTHCSHNPRFAVIDCPTFCRITTDFVPITVGLLRMPLCPYPMQLSLTPN